MRKRNTQKETLSFLIGGGFILFMVLAAGVNGKCAVKLLQKHHPHQLMGKPLREKELRFPPAC